MAEPVIYFPFLKYGKWMNILHKVNKERNRMISEPFYERTRKIFLLQKEKEILPVTSLQNSAVRFQLLLFQGNILFALQRNSTSTHNWYGPLLSAGQGISTINFLLVSMKCSLWGSKLCFRTITQHSTKKKKISQQRIHWVVFPHAPTPSTFKLKPVDYVLNAVRNRKTDRDLVII